MSEFLSEQKILIGIILATINLWTFFRFGLDKHFAETGMQRTPEVSLLMLAAIGGWPAALLARQYFRHKTRKEPFSTILLVISALESGAMLGVWLFVL